MQSILKGNKERIFTLSVICIKDLLFLEMNLCLKYKIFISEHIVIHFIANTPSVCRALMVKAIEVTQMSHKPYATIESTDFSNAKVFDNLV